MMSWKEKYISLKCRRIALFKSSVVWDKPYRAWIFDGNEGDIIIFIYWRLSWKEKLMTLAHEYGHKLLYRNNTWINQGVSGHYTEKEANATAIRALKSYGISKTEYTDFYNKIAKKQEKDIKRLK
jgi:hypothetical protein